MGRPRRPWVRRTTCTLLAAAVALGLGTAAAPDASAAGEDVVVQGWYRVFLGRTAENAAADQGRSHWVSRLQAGQDRQAVLTALLASPEAVTREVEGYYRRFLGHGLDAGASYWVDGVVRGEFVAEWAAQMVLASDEYRNTWTAGSADADAAWIRALYADVLQRSASAEEVTYWQGVLRESGRMRVVRSIWYADEAALARVDRAYRAVLGRPVDGAATYWVPLALGSEVSVRVGLGATAEFAARW
ncbi:DUF4214 domain-containing protein [Geodermatophilus nigrescens]